MQLGIFGSSGFAREVADLAFESGFRNIVFVDSSASSAEACDFPIVRESEIGRLVKQRYRFVIGIGDNQIRKRISGDFPSLPFTSIIHPHATVSHRMKKQLEKTKGTLVFPGVRMTNNITIGNFSVIYLNATVAHDSILENYVMVAPGATISGNVHVKEGAYIGANATVLQGKSLENKLTIGAWSTVGAGGVVTGTVPSSVIVRGVPAKEH
ncbi:NeuD/PglB/VioB family sugar acetyltransferase [Thalassobacillus hwangdonensis]|uniref:NeuD/PglB/VioB family sugar acetyltransferase n=1 Tax=Thalassobacillus hwangdonensis TaxID=546108 RepID=A0ABW3L3J8_9BACI